MEIWVLLIALIMASLMVCMVYYYREKMKLGDKLKRKARLPEGSLGWPFFGESLDFISCALSPLPESFMNKRRLLYGKVFKTHLFGSRTIVSTDSEINRFILQSDAKTFVPYYPKSLMELMGKSSILLINGSFQKRVHGLVASFLKSPQLKTQITTDLKNYMEQSMKAWNDGEIVYIQHEAKSIVFQILVKGLIGVEGGEEIEFIRQQFQQFIAGLMSLPIKIPGTRLYRSLQAKRRMATLIQKIIQEKRKNRDGGTARDAIDVLINDNNDQLTDELISDNMIDFMIPAEDSVPVLITLAIKYLSECPLALCQLEQENMELKKQKTELGEPLKWMDFKSLTFTQNVISESLRMGNIINSIMRKAEREVEIKGILIPKGWRVVAYLRSMHLDEQNYKDAYVFNPWRWKDKDINTSCFAPFGGGQRLCPGLDLARLEASIFLHHLVTNFTWVAEEDEVVNFPTVRMKGGMPIRVTRKC